MTAGLSAALHALKHYVPPPPAATYLGELNPFAVGLSVVLLYLATGHVGLQVEPVNTFATLLWAPSGIALAALILGGYRLWWAVALGAFLVNMSVGANPSTALLIAAGNTLEAFAAAYALRTYGGFSPLFTRWRDSFALVLAGLSAPVVAATIGVSSLVLGGTVPFSAFGATWTAWWLGDVAGILTVAPLLLKWLSRPYFGRTRAQYLEFVCISLVTVTTAVIVFGTFLPFAYFVIVPLAWTALRTGPRGTTLAVFLVSLVAVLGTLSGRGPFSGIPDGLFYMEIFLATVSGIFLIFVAVVEEMREAQKLATKHVSELERALERVSSEDKAKAEFLAILAHELRNPLSAILSSTELLKLESGFESAPLLDEIDHRVRGMGRMLEDLLEISHISHRRFTLQKTVISLNEVIEHAARAASATMHARGHVFSVAQPKEALFAEADATRLEQVVSNLLNNAAKYTPPGGTVKLSLEQEGKWAAIRVADTGAGIPKSMFGRIFEPFFQVERGKSTVEGLGIGLSLARELVNLHGGSIKVVSEGEGKGSEFTVRLPLIPAPTVKTPDRAVLRGGHALRQTQEPKRMLVVDDNEAAADGLAKLLRMRGHAVATAYNGEQALEEAHAGRPGGGILDIGLPDIDGYEIARTLRREKFSGTLVALTGYGLQEDKAKAAAAGFDKHLTKPVGLKELEAALRRAPPHVLNESKKSKTAARR